MQKNLKSIAVPLLLLLSGTLVFAREGEVKVSAANVRLEPNQQSAVVGYLRMGDVVEIYNEKDNWLEIKAPRLFVARHLIRDGRVDTSTRIRAGAGLQYPILGKFKAPTEVKILETSGEWARIAPHGDFHAYIAASLVKYEGAPAQPDAKPDGKPVRQPEPAPKIEPVQKPEPVKPESKPEKKPDPAPKPEKKPAPAPKPEKKPDAAPAPKAEKKPFAKLPVEENSARTVNGSVGLLYPMKDEGSGVGYMLLVAKKDEYQPVCFVYSGGTTKFKPFSEKMVKLSGTSYRVKGWEYPVLKVTQIIPQE